MDYTGFSFAEKKALTEKEDFIYPTALKQVHDKLGSDWKFLVDWPVIQAKAPANDRPRLPGFIYDFYVAKTGVEISKWSDLAAAVNDKVKGKKIILTLETSGKDLYLYDVKVDALAIQHTKLGFTYPYSSSHNLTADVENEKLRSIFAWVASRPEEEARGGAIVLLVSCFLFKNRGDLKIASPHKINAFMGCAVVGRAPIIVGFLIENADCETSSGKGWLVFCLL